MWRGMGQRQLFMWWDESGGGVGGGMKEDGGGGRPVEAGAQEAHDAEKTPEVAPGDQSSEYEVTDSLWAKTCRCGRRV